MDDYKREIERLVQPLRLYERRKNDLRRELWEHFCELVEQNRQDMGAEAAAAAALARLGSREDLAESVSRTQPGLDAFFLNADRLIVRPLGEPVLRHMLRSFWLHMVPAFLAIVTLGLVLSRLDLLASTIMIGLGFWSWIFCGLGKLSEIEQLYVEHARGARAYGQLALRLGQQLLVGVGAMAVVSGSGYFLLWNIAGLYYESVAYFYVTVLFLCFVLLPLVLLVEPVMLLVVSRYRNMIPDWPYGQC